MRFIDSNVFIYHLAGDPSYGKRAEEILLSIEGDEKAVTSTLVISQVCAYLKWKKVPDSIPIFIDLLRSLPMLEKHDTTFEDLTAAYALKGKTKLSWNHWDDLVIASQMARMGIEEIYSNDQDFDKIPHVRRIFKSVYDKSH